MNKTLTSDRGEIIKNIYILRHIIHMNTHVIDPILEHMSLRPGIALRLKSLGNTRTLDQYIPLYYTYSEYPLDTDYFPLWILSIMLRYYQFQKMNILRILPVFFSQSNYILQLHCPIALLHS